MKKLYLVMMLVFFAMTAIASAEPNMQEGKWEITMKMNMKGMPGMPAMPPMTHTQCLTRKDMVPQKAERNDECKILSNRIEGSTVSWVTQCRHKDGSVSDSDGRITYRGASFDGLINVTMKEGKRGAMKVTQKISGRRIGECK